MKSYRNRYDPKATKDMFELNTRDIRTNDKKIITKKANFELRKNFFLPLDQLQIGTCCQEKYVTFAQILHSDGA